MEPNEMLRASGKVLETCDEKSWQKLILFLLNSIKEWCGHDVVLESMEKAFIGEGFSIDIIKAGSPGESFFNWKGILGASIIEDDLVVVLFVFMYINGEVLVTNSGHNYAEYIYVVDKTKSNTGHWKLLGLFEDTNVTVHGL